MGSQCIFPQSKGSLGLGRAWVRLQPPHPDLVGVPPTPHNTLGTCFTNRSLGGLNLAPNMLNEGEQRPQGDRPKDYQLWGPGGTGHPSSSDLPRGIPAPASRLCHTPHRVPADCLPPGRLPALDSLATDHTFFG